MKLNVVTQPPSRIKADLAVAVLDPGVTLFTVDEPELRHVLQAAQRNFQEERQKREVFHSFPEQSPIRNLLIFSTTLSKNYNIWENVKIFAAKSLGYARGYYLGRIAFFLSSPDGAAFVGKATEGFLLGSYRFDKYKKNKTKDPELLVSIVVRPEDKTASDERLHRYSVVAQEANRCRDIVNEPGAVMYPEALARVAKRVASQNRLKCTVLDEKQLEKQGYGGLIAVGKGSVHPPRMIVLRYEPRRKSRHHLALVGKGITFDTGGISLKPPEGMFTMKGDMAGGAAVIYTMAAIGQLKPSLRVTGIVPTAENFPGNHAQRPGDIFIAKNGKSVMVDNTDAEGRLVLSDGLARAGEEGATHVVDIATLTGAVVRALGEAVAGVMGNDRHLVQAVIRSGENHGEVFWELPLVEEYKETLKTPYADLNNVGGKHAGAITAGLFLREFVPEGLSWAHLDIAGPYLLEKAWKYYGEGATGFGLKTMVDLCRRFEEYFPEQP
ncbi:MAG TPA: leucyl aminopeptidase [Vicinamibacteria bacterium]|nr:leucyl aminopeptidase [Vicinamibacteria bacterium]